MPHKIILFLTITFVLIACTPSVAISSPTSSPTTSQTSTPEITTTSSATPYPTSTAPAPLPTLPLIKPLPGLVFESYTTRGNGFPQDRILWVINQSGELVYLADRDEEQNLLSSDQKWLVHINYINHPIMDISELQNWVIKDSLQIWIEDRENNISKRLVPPPDCGIDTNMLSWSYDNKRLYYFASCKDSGLRDIWYLDLETWRSYNLTNSPERDEICVDYFLDCKISFSTLPNEILTTSHIPSPAEPPGTPPRWESHNYLTQINIEGKGYKVLDSSDGIFAPPSISFDGSSIAYDGGHIIEENGMMHNLTYGDLDTSLFPPKTVESHVDIVNPSWSPDGTKIAWDIAHTNGSNQTKVAIFDMSTQKWSTLLTFEPYWWNLIYCTCDTWHPRQLKWSSDSKWLTFLNVEFPDKEMTNRMDMFAEEHSSVWVFSRNGEKAFNMYGVLDLIEPVWSPDGNWLAFTSMSRDAKLSITVVKIGEWKAYKVDLPFEDVKLVDWVKSK